MNYLRRQLPVFACLCAVLTSHAAFDAYLKIEGVEGEATDSKHAKWIEIQSFTHGAATPSATTARPAFSDLCFTKFTDKSSPVLDQSCAQGKVFPSATIELVTADANRARFYQIVLSNVVATSISAMGNANDAAVKPAESVCLSFSQITWTYTELDASGVPAGDIRAWWDLAQNVGSSSVNPILRVTGTQMDANTLRLSWPANAGRTYTILGSSVVTGSYSVVRSIVSPSDGPMSLSLPMTAKANFFQVQETQ